jgi:hypothetical protein
VLRAGAPPEELPTMPKEELAAILIDRVIALVQDQHAEVSAEQ